MMSSASRWLRIGGAFAFLIRRTNGANTPGALSIVPSLNWYGSDGDWSAISLRVGTPQVWTDVMVSTVSSENWIVGTGACTANDSLCKQSRGGGLFNPLNSSTWHNEGFYQFMVDSQLGNNGYGWYGLDDMTLGSTGVTVSQTVIGQFNGSGPLTGTQYMLGMFGLGVTTARFANDSPLPLINALVEVNGVIPSHSYGYTAGAKYQQKGELLSLTLGGYDANRFVPHNVTFNLNPDNNPQASINTIFVESSATGNNFTTPRQLLQPSDRVSVIIDSSTPYLWLPAAVCDRFAQTLGLSYNDTLDLYTYDQNATQHDTLANSQLSFTFSLSDVSSSPAMVNITLPFQAFDLQLTYPAIPNSTYGNPDATKNYFPLRRATDESQYTIGRAFLQEAYLITDYERSIFSVHQAVHTANPLGNTSIVAILQPSDSKFTSVGGSAPDNGSAPLHRSSIIAVAVSSSVFVVLVSFLALFLCRRRRQKKAAAADEKSDGPQTTQTRHPRSFLSRMLRRAPLPTVHEAGGESAFPTEVAADASHERFELPAPLGLAELDSEAGTTFDGTTEHGSSTQDSANLSAYERARRKLERAQIAAAQAQAQISAETYPVEKNDAGVSQVAHYRAPDTPMSNEEALVSPIAPEPGNGWGTLNISHGSSEPSPVSPGFQSVPISPMGPPPTYRRLPFDPANVVYAGRLPDNVQLPNVVPTIVGPDGRIIRHEPTVTSAGDPEGTNSSFGSQFTVEEQLDDSYGGGNTNVVSPNPSNGSGRSDPTSTVSRSGGSGNRREPVVGRGIEEQSERPEMATDAIDPWSSRRRLHGEDLVHVPQPAEDRFSWEEDRISGHEERSL